MNTNGNAYTVIYTAIIVIVVAAVLAYAATALKPRQDANIKAETISQMLTAAGFGSKAEISAMGNESVLDSYAENVVEAFTVDANGEKNGTLSVERSNIEVADGLKAQDKLIKNGGDVHLPVYVFNKDGGSVTVIPVYGAGLWGPIWGYIAFEADLHTIAGAYFDHESETPGLGAKIKDDPAFQAQFQGKNVDFSDSKVFSIVKGGAPAGKANAVDAITGSTMTSKGLDAALNVWFEAYRPYLEGRGTAVTEDAEESCCGCGEDCGGEDGECCCAAADSTSTAN